MNLSRIVNKKCVLSDDNSKSPIFYDCNSMFRAAGFSDDQTALFMNKVVGVLDDYAELLGSGTEINYTIARTFFRLVLYVFIPGQNFNPFLSGKGARERSFENMLSLNLNNDEIHLTHKYGLGLNIINIGIPLSERKKGFLSDPTVLAVITGIICGLICQHLPSQINKLIVDEIASPLMTQLLKLLAGIMGPVIFISMTSSIVALDNVEELTSLGFRMIRRFALTTLFLIALSMIISEPFFKHVSGGNVSISADKLIDMTVDLLPTNLIQPFLDNKTPQLVIMGFILGVALLLMGDKATELKKLLIQIDEWAMTTMRIVLFIVPAIPFLSIMTAIAGGNGKNLLGGWKFVAAVYIVFTVAVVVKAVKTSLVTRIGISTYWKKMKPVIMISFTTGSTTVPLKKFYEISKEDLNIKPEFSSFWIPMSSAMLSPKTTINLVIAAFMVAQIAQVNVTESFLVVLIILTLELSLASPGTTSAWTILFETLAMGTNYVGLLAAYRILTENYSAACTEAYCMLEEVEAAHKLGGIME